jgi:hypothetical protein
MLDGIVDLTRLGTVDRESEIMILEVETHTRKVNNRLDASLFNFSGSPIPLR